MDLMLNSPAFHAGGTLPDRYTCNGINVSPPLEWQGVPQGTESLVLIFDDPDASDVQESPFAHWVLYNISPAMFGLPEDYRLNDDSSNEGSSVEATLGRNTMGNTGYEGPCPPLGSTHRYYFRLYALDTTLEITPGATRDQVLDQTRDHILAETELLCSYGRSR